MTLHTSKTKGKGVLMTKVAVMLATGYEEGESLFVVDIMRRAGFECDSVSIEEEQVTAAMASPRWWMSSSTALWMPVMPWSFPGACLELPT